MISQGEYERWKHNHQQSSSSESHHDNKTLEDQHVGNSQQQSHGVSTTTIMGTTSEINYHQQPQPVRTMVATPNSTTTTTTANITSNSTQEEQQAHNSQVPLPTTTFTYDKAPIHSIPNTNYTMVLFPGRVKNVSNAIQMLGGMKSIQKLHKKNLPNNSTSTASKSKKDAAGKKDSTLETANNSSSDSKFLECRFRPSNFMSCHPVYGDAISTNNLLVRIRRKKIKKLVGDRIVTRYDSSNSEISVLGTISKTVNFKGMSDFQYIQPKYVDLDQSMDVDQNGSENGGADNNFSNSIDHGDENGDGEDDETMHTELLDESSTVKLNNTSSQSGSSSTTTATGSATGTTQRNVYYSDELSEATSTTILPTRASLEHPHTGKGTKHVKAMLALPPPIFSRFDMPMDYAFKQNPLSEVVPIVSHDGSSNYKRLIKKNKQYVPHCVEINFEDDVPMGPPPDIVNAKDRELYTDMEKKLRKLFGYDTTMNDSSTNNNNNEEVVSELKSQSSRKVRPMWSRSAITSKFESRKDRWKLRMVLPRIAYHYKSGPWRMIWVRYGFDPRKELSAAYYQMLDFRIPQELRPKINALAGKKKEDEMETNKFRRLPKRRTDLHIDLHDYLYSPSKGDKSNESTQVSSSAAATAASSSNTTTTNYNAAASTNNDSEENAAYEFNSIPTQIQVFYQLCDIRISSAQNIVMAEKDEKIPITYGVLLGIRTGEELGLREPVWNQNAECDPKSGWFTHHALEQIRHIMKKKIEEWIEVGEENDHEILSDTDEDEPESEERPLLNQAVIGNSDASFTDDEMRDDGEDLFIGATTGNSGGGSSIGIDSGIDSSTAISSSSTQ